MAMGNMTKVFALFKTSFWLENGFSGEVVSNGGPSAIKGCTVWNFKNYSVTQILREINFKFKRSKPAILTNVLSEFIKIDFT